jgi:hypothetical protein
MGISMEELFGLIAGVNEEADLLVKIMVELRDCMSKLSSSQRG